MGKNVLNVKSFSKIMKILLVILIVGLIVFIIVKQTGKEDFQSNSLMAVDANPIIEEKEICNYLTKPNENKWTFTYNNNNDNGMDESYDIIFNRSDTTDCDIMALVNGNQQDVTIKQDEQFIIEGRIDENKTYKFTVKKVGSRFVLEDGIIDVPMELMNGTIMGVESMLLGKQKITIRDETSLEEYLDERRKQKITIRDETSLEEYLDERINHYWITNIKFNNQQDNLNPDTDHYQKEYKKSMKQKKQIIKVFNKFKDRPPNHRLTFKHFVERKITLYTKVLNNLEKKYPNPDDMLFKKMRFNVLLDTVNDLYTILSKQSRKKISDQGNKGSLYKIYWDDPYRSNGPYIKISKDNLKIQTISLPQTVSLKPGDTYIIYKSNPKRKLYRVAGRNIPREINIESSNVPYTNTHMKQPSTHGYMYDNKNIHNKLTITMESSIAATKAPTTRAPATTTTAAITTRTPTTTPSIQHVDNPPKLA